MLFNILTISMAANRISAQRPFVIITVYFNMFYLVLPVLKQPPNVRNVSVTMATLEWPAWSSEADEGDPPVVGYTVYVTSNTTGGLEEHVGANNNSIPLSKLEPNTTYEFRVAAVREGEGGTGPASPPVYATTLPPGEFPF